MLVVACAKLWGWLPVFELVLPVPKKTGQNWIKFRFVTSLAALAVLKFRVLNTALTQNHEGYDMATGMRRTSL